MVFSPVHQRNILQLFNENWAPNPHHTPSLTTSASEPPADLSCGHLRMQTLHTPALLPCTHKQGQRAFACREHRLSAWEGSCLGPGRTHAHPVGFAKPQQKNCARGARAGKQAACSRQALHTAPAPLGGRERPLHSCTQQSWVAPRLFHESHKSRVRRISTSSCCPCLPHHNHVRSPVPCSRSIL